MPTDHIIGLDLGQAQDYTALAVLERSTTPSDPPSYAIRHLHRFPLGTPYTAVVPAVAQLAAAHPLCGCPVVADQTGVGRAVVDALRAAEPRPRVVAVTITGGQKATAEKDGFDEQHAVPKKELVGVLQLLLQGRRLKVAASLPEAAILTRELQAFRSKVSVATGHESFEAWRERDHDDLVLAVALACWWAEAHPQSDPVIYVPPKSEYLQWVDRMFPGV